MPCGNFITGSGGITGNGDFRSQGEKGRPGSKQERVLRDLKWVRLHKASLRGIRNPVCPCLFSINSRNVSFFRLRKADLRPFAPWIVLERPGI